MPSSSYFHWSIPDYSPENLILPKVEIHVYYIWQYLTALEWIGVPSPCKQLWFWTSLCLGPNPGQAPTTAIKKSATWNQTTLTEIALCKCYAKCNPAFHLFLVCDRLDQASRGIGTYNYHLFWRFVQRRLFCTGFGSGVNGKATSANLRKKGRE